MFSEVSLARINGTLSNGERFNQWDHLLHADFGNKLNGVVLLLDYLSQKNINIEHGRVEIIDSGGQRFYEIRDNLIVGEM